MTILEFSDNHILLIFALFFLASILLGVFLGKIMRWCGRYDDQLGAGWKPPEEE